MRRPMDSLLDVIDEDDDRLVVNKPAGLVCHPTKNGERSSLIGRVRLYLGHGEGRLVNRLDRETSGLVVIAKSGRTARDLGLLFESGVVEKSYVAVVHGLVATDTLRIVAPLGKDERSEIAIKDRVRADGAPAETQVRVVSRLARDDGEYSVIDVRPRTGRKHQIRIHLAHVGHPIVGDKLYGADEQRYLRLVRGELTATDRQALILPYHALHAARLSFDYQGTRRSWHAPTPAMVAAFIDLSLQT